MTSPAALSSADSRLLRRLELGHADSGLSYARAFAERNPEFGVAFEQIADGWAIFQGPESPVTQALAIGSDRAVTSEEMKRLEDFYHSRGSAAVIDLASMADASVLGLLQERRLVIREISNVLARRILPGDQFSSQAFTHTERVAPAQVRDWARVIVRGFTEQDVTEEQLDVMAVTPSHLHPYIGRKDGEYVAGAGMLIFEALATFAGDATLPGARRSGWQLALIYRRLQDAAEMGCDMATVSVMPGGTSHRNYHRAGFELIYSRVQIAIPQ